MTETIRTRLDQAWAIGQHGRLTMTVELDVAMPSNGWTIFSNLPGRIEQVVSDLSKYLDKAATDGE